MRERFLSLAPVKANWRRVRDRSSERLPQPCPGAGAAVKLGVRSARPPAAAVATESEAAVVAVVTAAASAAPPAEAEMAAEACRHRPGAAGAADAAVPVA